MNHVESNIIAVEVKNEEERLCFLPKHVGWLYLHYEMALYSWMERLADSYNGGFWSFFELSNGGFFMKCDQEKTFQISSENYFSGTLSSTAASIVANLYALSQLACTYPDSDFLAKKYHCLIEYVNQLPEAGLIYMAID